MEFSQSQVWRHFCSWNQEFFYQAVAPCSHSPHPNKAVFTPGPGPAPTRGPSSGARTKPSITVVTLKHWVTHQDQTVWTKQSQSNVVPGKRAEHAAWPGSRGQKSHVPPSLQTAANVAGNKDGFFVFESSKLPNFSLWQVWEHRVPLSIPQCKHSTQNVKLLIGAGQISGYQIFHYALLI